MSNDQGSSRTTDATQPVYPVARALRKAGFVPLPRLWVRGKDIPRIHKIAYAYQEEVNQIRREVAEARNQTEPDPVADKDAAWEAYEKFRNGN